MFNSLQESLRALQAFTPGKVLLSSLKELSEEIVDCWLDDQNVNNFQEMYSKYISVAEEYAISVKRKIEDPNSDIFEDCNVRIEDWSFSHEFGVAVEYAIVSMLSEYEIAEIMFLFALGWIYLEEEDIKVIPEFLSTL